MGRIEADCPPERCRRLGRSAGTEKRAADLGFATGDILRVQPGTIEEVSQAGVAILALLCANLRDHLREWLLSDTLQPMAQLTALERGAGIFPAAWGGLEKGIYVRCADQERRG